MSKLSVRRLSPVANQIDGEFTLAERLGPTSPTPTRIEALLGLGVEVEELADALGVTATTIRNWLSGDASPRRATVRVIDDLRQVVVVLADAGIEGAETAQWLRSRQGGALENGRPLDVIGDDPVRVLAAAHGLAIGEDGGAASGA